mmetsp:Transcript_2651/g.7775  ORF Transcript_2651/g.7775 Transcript_2651/m.7775 type:complete len:215 (+) Transcript_2651:3409-4053(+)
MKPRGAAMSKPDWANVAESAKASKSDWAHRTRGPGSFQYTVKVPLPVRQTDGVHRRRAVQRQGRAGHRRRRQGARRRAADGRRARSRELVRRRPRRRDGADPGRPNVHDQPVAAGRGRRRRRRAAGYAAAVICRGGAPPQCGGPALRGVERAADAATPAARLGDVCVRHAPVPQPTRRISRGVRQCRRHHAGALDRQGGLPAAEEQHAAHPVRV